MAYQADATARKLERDTETALYFPYIQVPRTPWFNQVLLYWDKAASIVPREAVTGDIDPYMRSLHAEGLLEYLNPLEALQYEDSAFEEGFVRLLGLTADRVPPDHLRTYTAVHVDKLGFRVFQEMNLSGLTEPGLPRFGNWYRIESTIAGLYMSYLAGVISGARHGTLPVTDQVDPLIALTRPTTERGPGIAELRHAYISRALPAPSGPVEPRELVDFKQRYGDELLRCRRYLDGRLSDLATLDDPDIRQARGNQILQEIQDDVARLSEQMARRRWPGIGLTGFCGIGTAGLGAAGAALGGGSVLAVAIAVGGAILGGIPAVRDVADNVRAPRFDHRAPLAYAALAAQQFGL